MSSRTHICSFLSCCLSFVSRAHLANIFLWATAILCSVSFLSPSWLIKEGDSSSLFWTIPRKDVGLLSECYTPGRCTWVWENGFWLEFNMEEWRRVLQFLVLSGLLHLLPVLLMSPFRFCCKCGYMSARISGVFAVITSLSVCFFGSAVIYFSYVVIWADMSATQEFAEVNRWSWAFEACSAGTCFAFASSMFWYLDSRREVDSVTSRKPEWNKA